MQRLILTLIAVGLLFAGCQTLSTPRGRMRLLSLAGVEVPGLDMPLSDIPYQYTTDGRPQVLVYGPTNCAPTAQTVQLLAQHHIPHLFRNANDEASVSQEELGAILLSLPADAPGGSPLVLVNGKVLVRPTIHDIWAEYTQMKPRQL